MSGLDILGIVATVLIIQLLVFALFVAGFVLAVRRKWKRFTKRLAENLEKVAKAMETTEEDPDIVPREAWDRALADPALADLLKHPSRRTRGNPRQRFVEPGHLDL